MHIQSVPNRNASPTILLRESYRVGKQVRKKTLANLTHWPASLVETLRLALAGESLVPKEKVLRIERSKPHGHVDALLTFMRHIGLEKIISSTPSQERDLVMAMLVERLIHSSSKLATTRLWNSSTLAEEMGVEGNNANDLYAAMDWLLNRQERIEGKLAARHLQEGSYALYDVSSSYFEGSHCPLAAFGHNKDGKRGKKIVVYGLLTSRLGCPVGINIYPGNTSDPNTFADQVHALKERFGLSQVTLVGDRGVLTQARIDTLRAVPGIGFLSALRSTSIRALVENGDIQMSLFDTQNLCEIVSKEYPGERLVACFNPLLAAERARKRQALLAATEEKLEAIAKDVGRRKEKVLSKEDIALRVGRIIDRYKMRKHFDLVFGDGYLSYCRITSSIEREAALDGIYVLRTNAPKEVLSAEDTVVTYKSLSQVERAFRSMKGMDIRIRPIRHFTEEHVRAHIFLCMLAYYVEWHLRRALGGLLYDDTDLDSERWVRDPIKPAQSSRSAAEKKKSGEALNGFAVHSFETMMVELATRCRHTCSSPGSQGMTFTMETEPTPWQTKVMDLLKSYAT
jgi:Transposase DDE domain